MSAWLIGLAPLTWLAARASNSQLGANPVEMLEHHTGLWALRLLLLALAMTPLKNWLHSPAPLAARRVLGLFAYAYACLHFAIYLLFDLSLSPARLAEDLIERGFIAVGFAAWLLLLPLALTSTRAWQQRLRHRWKAMHRLAYPAALLASVHFIWLVKSDAREALVHLAILTVLLLLRLQHSRCR